MVQSSVFRIASPALRCSRFPFQVSRFTLHASGFKFPLSPRCLACSRSSHPSGCAMRRLPRARPALRCSRFRFPVSAFRFLWSPAVSKSGRRRSRYPCCVIIWQRSPAGNSSLQGFVMLNAGAFRRRPVWSGLPRHDWRRPGYCLQPIPSPSRNARSTGFFELGEKMPTPPTKRCCVDWGVLRGR